VEVGGEVIKGEHLVIATGSELQPPQLRGLAQVDWWSSERLLTSFDLPSSALLLGGGPVGCELAQVLARFGCRVTLVESAEWLLAGEEPELGAVARQILESDGVEVLTDRTIHAVENRPGGGVAASAGDSQLEAEILLIATGRRPRLHGLGLEEVYGIYPDATALTVDGFGRAHGQDRLWGIGDVTGIAPFTHTASYQGRVVAANLRGDHLEADYRAIPRCVYLDPPVAAVGLTVDQAREQGLAIRLARVDLRESARSLVDGEQVGFLELVEDHDRGELVGACAVGPSADEWIGWAVLAIRARVPIGILADTVAPFPTYLELYRAAIERLAVPE
jgi:dihydrolipoamide dehydrogenase